MNSTTNRVLISAFLTNLACSVPPSQSKISSETTPAAQPEPAMPPAAITGGRGGQFDPADPNFAALLRTAPSVAIGDLTECSHDCRGGQTDRIIFRTTSAKGPALNTVGMFATDAFLCGLGSGLEPIIFSDSPSPRFTLAVIAARPKVTTLRGISCDTPATDLSVDGEVLGFAIVDDVPAAKALIARALADAPHEPSY